MYEYIILEMSNYLSDQRFLNTITFNEFNSFPQIMVTNSEEDNLQEENILQGVNRVLNDSRYEDYGFNPDVYVRVYIGNDHRNVRMYQIKKCGIYLGTIDTEQQYFNTPPQTPPQTPPREGMNVVSPYGGKRKSKKNKNLNKRIFTRKGGSKETRLDLRITDENGKELFVPVIKDKNGNLTYSEDANIFATIRSDGVPPIYSPKMKDFDTIAFQNRGKSKNNKTKKKSN
jgi:hypothetical protein